MNDSQINFFDPTTLKDDIINWAKTNADNSDEIIGTLNVLFSNSDLTQTIEDKIKPLFLDLDDRYAQNGAVGAIGYFLFCYYADSFKYAIANMILAKQKVINFIYGLYQIEKQHQYPPLNLHRTGTTSYILRNTHHKKAIKIIKYPYLFNYLINQQTENYSDKFVKIPSENVPEIEISKPQYIIMDFIEGITLREYMDQLTKSDSGIAFKKGNKNIPFSSVDYLNIVNSIFVKLCIALGECAKSNILHLDLSPNNVIIQLEDNGPAIRKIYLIDFGQNYLLNKRIGFNGSLSLPQYYIAPELRNSVENGSIKSDIFSLGILLLEALSSDKLDTNSDSPMLDEVWKKYPGYGKLIEELIDKEPDARLFEIEENLYLNIEERLNTEFIVFKEAEKEKKSHLIMAFLEIFRMDYAAVEQLFNLFKKNREPLVIYSSVAKLLNFAIFAIFGIFLWKGDYAGLPGRIVGISFSLVATAYYINIFSTLSTRNFNRHVNWYIRFNSFCFSLPILWTMLKNPSDWPFCSAIGVFLVAINNQVCLNLAKHAKKEIASILKLPTSLSSSVTAFFDTFKNWPYLMFVYCFVLVVVGILLKLGFAKDEWIYALLTAVGANYLNMYRTNCTKDAPTIRGGLERMFFGLDRAKRYEIFKIIKP